MQNETVQNVSECIHCKKFFDCDARGIHRQCLQFEERKDAKDNED